jgi:hypothetical protein
VEHVGKVRAQIHAGLQQILADAVLLCEEACPWALSSGTKEGSPQTALGRPEKASRMPAAFGKRAVSSRSMR